MSVLGRWATLANTPTVWYNLAAAEAGGIIYAIGGHDGSNRLNRNEAYDPSTNSWSTKANMPTARSRLAAAEAGGIIYAIGGYDGSNRLNINEAYDPSTNSWSTKANMPTARDSLAAAEAGGIIYAIGGHDGSNRLNRNEAYDPSTNSWSTKANMPTARYGLAAAEAGGIIYAIGGYTTTATNINEAYLTPSSFSVGTVTVRDEQGNNVSGARVWILYQNAELARLYLGTLAECETTDANGQATIYPFKMASPVSIAAVPPSGSYGSIRCNIAVE
ncbi:MAG: hypothetical protein QXY39_02670 [Thermofilaceae archaeon]